MDQTNYFVNTVKMLWRCVKYARDGVADSSDLKRWLDLTSGAIAKVSELIESSTLDIHKKKTCHTSCGQLHSIRRLLNACMQKIGGGLVEVRASVTWDDTKSAFKNNLKTSVITNVNHLDITSFMEDACVLFASKIEEALLVHKTLKIDTILAAEYAIVKDNEEIVEVKYFNTKCASIYTTTDLKEWFVANVKQPIERDMEEFQERDSGWTLKSILNLTVNMKKFSPMKAASYIELPKSIQSKKACVNVQNQDNECFKWAILSALHPVEKHAQRVSKYQAYANELIFKDIEFPVSVKQIPKFEKQNDVSVNLFILKKKGSVFDVSPCHLTALKKDKHVNLLLVQDTYIDESEEEQQGNLRVPLFHYVWIKDLSRLVYSQVSKHKERKHLCDRCLHYFRDEAKLEAHVVDCTQVNKCKVLLPQEKDSVLEFKNVNNKERVPIVVYADFECILKPVDDTRAYQEHQSFSIGCYVQYSHDESKCKYVSYRRETEQDEDPAKWFVSQLHMLAEELTHMHENPVPMKDVDQRSFDMARTCHICGGPFNATDIKIRDHCHLTGQYRGAAHNSCNLNYKDSRTIPVVFHNLSGYDSHLFIIELANSFKGRVSIIPQNKEKYISFTKFIDGSEINFKFIDSFRFMPSSLDKLASYLDKLEIVDNEFKKEFSDAQIELLRRKGVFPYDHIKSFDNLNETSLPDKESFFSSLYNSGISEEDYTHAQTVWNVFNIQTLGQYSDLYLKTDVLLLANVFEDFRTKCLHTYELDPAHYYTTPGFTWDAMLKYTGIKLQLLTDIDMLLFVERGIRGGISQCSNRYAKANNRYMESGYDEDEESKYLMYYDVNNLYGWAMTQSLPCDGFKWVEDLNRDFFNVPDDAPMGYILEVDLEYPEDLHDAHKDLPLCPEHAAPPGSKQEKLLTTLNNKELYVLHYVALKQALKYGLRLKNIHRALQFNQNPWLKPYIDLNSEKRKNAKNEFEKMLFKLFNNAVYGKTMENERKRVDVKLVNKWEGRYGCEAYIAQPNFHSCSIFDENLVAVQLARTEISVRKPIYIGLAVLDLSKSLVYRFHYEYMQERVGDKAKLLYTDTDSLIYEVSDIDMYAVMKADLHKFDTSDYPPDNQFNIPLVNKKIVGLMKDECNGNIMTEFVGLRSKMYSVKVQGQQPIKKAKGVKSSVVKSTIEFDDYIHCLRDKATITREQKNIRSRLHVIRTEKEQKIALSPHDDKRYLIPGQTDTLPWGHHMIDGYQLIEAADEPPAKRARLD